MGYFDNTDNEPEREIGDIGNYYGSLHIKKDGGKYYWSIENWDGDNWEEIPQSLYDELNKFQDSKEG